jgi:hypothetical protein
VRELGKYRGIVFNGSCGSVRVNKDSFEAPCAMYGKWIYTSSRSQNREDLERVLCQSLLEPAPYNIRMDTMHFARATVLSHTR